MFTFLSRIPSLLVKVFKTTWEAYIYRNIKTCAHHGNEVGLYHLGCLFETGNTAVRQDPIRAYCLFARSAEKGYKEAQKRLELLEAIWPANFLSTAKEKALYYKNQGGIEEFL